MCVWCSWHNYHHVSLSVWLFGRFFVCCSHLWSFVALPPLCGGVPARTLCRLCLSCTCLSVCAGDLYFCLHGLFHTRKLSPGRHIGWLVLGAWRHKVTFLSIDFNIRMSVSLPPSLSLPVFGGVLATALCVLCTISFSLSPPVYSFFSRCRWYWHQSSVVHVWFLRIIVFFFIRGRLFCARVSLPFVVDPGGAVCLKSGASSRSRFCLLWLLFRAHTDLQ